MKASKSHVSRLASLVLLLAAHAVAGGRAAPSGSPQNPANPLISSFMFRDVPIEYAMSMLGETWGRHIVVNDSAKQTSVRTFLKNIDCHGALKAICHGHGLC